MATEKRLIDANALIDRVDESKHNNPHPQGMVRVNHRNEHAHFLRMICEAPTVDAVEVVHGRWETANDGTHFCPHCGCDAPYTWDDIDRSFINSADDVPDRPSNYCPNCGAKVDSDGNK